MPSHLLRRKGMGEWRGGSGKGKWQVDELDDQTRENGWSEGEEVDAKEEKMEWRKLAGEKGEIEQDLNLLRWECDQW